MSTPSIQQSIQQTFQKGFAHFKKTASTAGEPISKGAGTIKGKLDGVAKEGPLTLMGRKVDELTAKIPNEKLALLVNKTIKAAPVIAAFVLLPPNITLIFWLSYTAAHIVGNRPLLGADAHHHIYNGIGGGLLFTAGKIIAKAVIALAPAAAGPAIVPIYFAGIALWAARNSHEHQLPQQPREDVESVTL